jgi:signal transduction histidine kinase/ActR/RegA family two-component response regulator/HPt (histidine-containing phosphotransfer) domain-containing protein
MSISRRTATYALPAVFCLTGLAVLAASLYVSNTLERFIVSNEANIRRGLRESAARLTMMATAEELGSYRGPEDMETPSYRALRLKLVAFAKNADVKYAYYLRFVGDRMQYIVDNDFVEGSRVGLDTPPSPIEETPGLSDTLEGKVGFSGLGQYMPGWDGLSSAYAPMHDAAGEIFAVAGVDIEDDVLHTAHERGQLAMLLELVSCVMVLASGAYGLISYRREASAARTASAAKSRFLSRMSHEIRTPMNAVLGMGELALMDYGRPEGREHIRSIGRAGRHLLVLIDEILDISALESGKLKFRAEPYEAASMLNDALQMTKVRLRDKAGVELLLDIDPRVPSVLVGDEARVKAVLLNLLSNAAKYTPNGFIRLAVRAMREGGGCALTFEVSDSGIGIRPEDMDTLFGDFSRIGDRQSTGIQGTGLGLSITRSLCRAMGGDATAESQYGEGSTFTATLRQGVADESPMGDLAWEAAHDAESSPTAGFAAPDFRVLVVDDSLTNLKVAAGLLAAYRIKADTCQSGREAVALVQRSGYDMVLMDHMMPGMDGLEATAAIRALGGAHLNLPVVALTANAVTGARERLLAGGFDDFLSKPIEIPKLGGLLERWVPAPKRVALPDAQGGDPRWEAVRGVEGLDTARGLVSAGGAAGPYMELLEIYCRDARSRMGALSVAEADMLGFTTSVHALKSASASIGATGIAGAATALEDAGLRGDTARIRGSAGAFRDALAALVEKIEGALRAGRAAGEKTAGEKAAAPGMLLGMLGALKDALEKEDVGQADRLLEDLSAARPGGEMGGLLSRVSGLVLASEFREAARAIAAFTRDPGGD